MQKKTALKIHKMLYEVLRTFYQIQLEYLKKHQCRQRKYKFSMRVVESGYRTNFTYIPFQLIILLKRLPKR